MKNRQSPFRTLRFIVLVLLTAAAYRLVVPNTESHAAGYSPFGVVISIDPQSVTLPPSSIKQFKATVTGGATNKVTWSLYPPSGVPATKIGTIDANGIYTAPSVAWAGSSNAFVIATSVDSPSVYVTAKIFMGSGTPPPPPPQPVTPTTTSVVPNSLVMGGAFTITVNGGNFQNGAQVLWNGSPLTTSFVSASKLTATGIATPAGSSNITVKNPGGLTSSPALVINVIIPISVAVSPTSTTVPVSGTQQFAATVTGNANQAVTWQVNGITGGDPANGLISATGLYTAPAAIPTAGFATITAISQADNTTKGSATITVKDPMAITYGRFLDQTTFGPTPALMAHVRQIGMQGFLDEQFTAPESSWPNLSTAQRSDAIDAFFGNAENGQDQLRQRMIYALSEITVIAMNKNTNGDMLVPWLQLLSRNSFGNYRTLLKELTLDASMGNYLDLVNSGGGVAPNENYPRELMQLFSIGLYQLNNDGSQKLDQFGNPIPTYSQTDVQQLARALTGWTYSNATNTSGPGGNYNYYPGPMIPAPGRHITSAKTVLGQTIPAGQTIQQDLDSALDIVFNHPNVGPFIATRLIRALVTSNPSPAYVSRVADAFNNTNGVRGDLKAVIQAIIMDQEARNDTPPANFGRLRTPMQHIIAFARAFNINLGSASNFAYLFYNMNEGILDAPSVFGHYSPLYVIPNSGGLHGPEFQIYSASDAANRANFFYSLIYNPWPINPILQPYVNIAGNSTALINAVDNALLYGRMSQTTRTAIANALPAMYDNNQRVMTAIYMTVTSGEHLIQR
ncbi:MAG TPA: DUF1800 family protein [Blastocatellia bacterium]|nr:DUF1800 family protein [Blastocatellia bacterium]